MTVRVATFEAHLNFLPEHGYQIVPLRRIVAWLREPDATLPPRAVALTVDDGHRSVYERLFPIVQREQLPVALFVYPSAISNASYALTWEQLREMHATGLVDVQSHTWWHLNLNVEQRRQSPVEFERFATTQLLHSRELIESKAAGTSTCSRGHSASMTTRCRASRAKPATWRRSRSTRAASSGLRRS